MKPLTLSIFLCFAFSALRHAAQRKMGYEHRENLFVADVDGTHAKKIAAGALRDFPRRHTRRVQHRRRREESPRSGASHRDRRPGERQSHGSTKYLSLIHISEPTRLGMISYAVFCLKKK